MARVPRGRHVGYTAAGIPVVRHPGGRQVGYTSAGIPIHAYAWQCCDKFCTDEEVSGGTCYVEADCWPFGQGPR
jgi:hypothetical protein